MNDNKLKNFLINGFQPLEEREGEETEEYREKCSEDIGDDDQECLEETCAAPQEDGGFDFRSSMKDLETELIRIRYLLEDMAEAEPPQPVMPDLSQYMTTREQFKSVTAAVSRRDAETGYKAMVNAMEAISVMREDFFKLCQGMRERIDELSAETVLSSFEAYSVDMENILTDGGVFIGAFPYDRLNTLHHRIVGVVPTGEVDKDGMIAERLSDGYKMGDKVLLKEKVKVYKYDPKLAPAEDETDSETSSETACETDSEPAGEVPTEEDKAEISQEEEE